MTGGRVGIHPSSVAAQGSVAAERHRLVLPNRLSELRRVSAWVHGFALANGFTRERVHALELSVNEAITNIISYGYADDAPHEIVVQIWVHPDRIFVQIEDDGVPFNPLALRPEKPPVSLEHSRPNGRGIPLMRDLTDELNYVRLGNTNILTMAMRCTKS